MLFITGIKERKEESLQPLCAEENNVVQQMALSSEPRFGTVLETETMKSLSFMIVDDDDGALPKLRFQ